MVSYLTFGYLHVTRFSSQQTFHISNRLVIVIPMVNPVLRFNLIMNTDAVLCVRLKCLTTLLFNQDILAAVD